MKRICGKRATPPYLALFPYVQSSYFNNGTLLVSAKVDRAVIEATDENNPRTAGAI